LGDQPRRPGSTRLPITVTEENVAPQLEEKVARPVPRVRTPVGMPAPPPTVIINDGDRQSRDDIERVAEIDRIERERAQLLVELQDVKQENRLLRETTPTVVFPPPPSIPPPPAHKAAPASGDLKVFEDDGLKAIERAIVGSRLGRAAIGLGVLIALAWNAFNMVRADEPKQKTESLQARLSQTEQISTKDAEAQALERERNLRRWRATVCYMKQLRGAVARQGLDLPSLPPGGIKALRLGDEDPNRPGPPRFVAEEKCPDFPDLPPDVGSE
jgi:hypothetical protein